MSGFKRFLLWDYPRASWQYDVMVALILAFIFLTPRELFRDQPKASNIVRLQSDGSASVFWMEPELLESVPEPDRGSTTERLLRSRFGRTEPVSRVEPILGSEREIRGYMAYTHP